jgi:glycerol-3-phosphate dehydrogenase
VPPALASRWWQAYGTRVDRMLGDAAGLHDLGQDFGAGLFQREVDYLCREEWASTAEDILWRRSHCGLHMTPAQRAALAQWLQRGA